MAVALDAISVLPTDGRLRRPRVLLSTERGTLEAGGGVATWCDLLVRGLPEVDFAVLAVAGDAGAGVEAPRGGWPPNVVSESVVPARAGTVQAIVQDGRWHRLRRERPSEAQVEREFAPLLHALLDAAAAETLDAHAFAAALAGVHDHLRRWDAAGTWQARPLWESFRARFADAPGGDQASLGEAVEALRWTQGALAVLALDLPPVDLVHATSAGGPAIPAIVARHRRGTPFLLTEHHVTLRDAYLACERRGYPFALKRYVMGLVSAIVRTAYETADQISPVCRFNARWEAAHGAPPDRIRVIYSGVDEEAFRPQDLTPRSRPSVVTVARVAPAKDLETMLRVADRVRREIPEVQFLQYGPVDDEEYRQRVLGLWHDRRLEDTVRFMGRVDRIADVLNRADVVLLTSVAETLPYSVLEALMCGRPVVATASGGVTEALEGPGVTAAPGDAEALADAVVAVLRLPPAQRLRLAEAARERALERFRLRSFLGAYRESYAALSPGAFRLLAPEGWPEGGPGELGQPVSTVAEKEEPILEGTPRHEAVDAGAPEAVEPGVAPAGVEPEPAEAALEADMALLEAERSVLEAAQAELAAQQAAIEAERAEMEAEEAVVEAERAEMEAEEAVVEAERAEMEAQEAVVEAEHAELSAEEAEVESDRARLEAEQAVLEAAEALLETGDAEPTLEQDAEEVRPSPSEPEGAEHEAPAAETTEPGVAEPDAAPTSWEPEDERAVAIEEVQEEYVEPEVIEIWPAEEERLPAAHWETEPADEDVAARARAASAVGSFGEPAELQEVMVDPDPFVRMAAISRVRDSRFAGVLVAALADDFPQVRREAVRALGRVDGPAAAPALARAVSQDPSAEVREEAVAALASLLGRGAEGRLHA